MPEIRTWANSVGQQIENMTVDLVATTAAGISEAAGDVFFVGRPASNNAQEWILKKITPTELNKMVYNYLTSPAIANLFASVLGGTSGVDIADDLNNEKGVSGRAYIHPIFVTSNKQNLPPSMSEETRFWFELYNHANYYIVQTVINAYNGKTFRRSFYLYINSWTEWKEL